MGESPTGGSEAERMLRRQFYSLVSLGNSGNVGDSHNPLFSLMNGVMNIHNSCSPRTLVSWIHRHGRFATRRFHRQLAGYCISPQMVATECKKWHNLLAIPTLAFGVRKSQIQKQQGFWVGSVPRNGRKQEFIWGPVCNCLTISNPLRRFTQYIPMLLRHRSNLCSWRRNNIALASWPWLASATRWPSSMKSLSQQQRSSEQRAAHQCWISAFSCHFHKIWTLKRASIFFSCWSQVKGSAVFKGEPAKEDPEDDDRCYQPWFDAWTGAARIAGAVRFKRVKIRMSAKPS